MQTRKFWIAASLVLAVLTVRIGLAQEPALDKTTQLLIELIKVDTSNPPGHENQVDLVLEPTFKALGFETEIVPTPEPGKSHLFARLRGDSSKKPILLAAHADVVGVEREKWTVDPFAGVVKDGEVYGRGAVDNKGSVAVFARAVMMLAENRVPLARDVIFLSEADEEGRPYNTSWLAKEHWAKMDAEFALNECGWIIKSDQNQVRYVSISVADKRGATIMVTATGTSTHSSMPRPDSAIVTLAKAVATIADYAPKVELTPVQRQFLTALAKTSPPPLSDAYRTLVTSTDPVALEKADREIRKDPFTAAFFRNTVAFTFLKGGVRSNVIPGSAEATINVRSIPGTDLTALVRDLQRVVNDPRVEIKLAAPPSSTPPPEPSSEDTDLYRALARQARAEWPGAEVTPSLCMGGTDATAWRSRGVPVYGIDPYPLTADEMSRLHGNDERVSIESLRQGTDFIYKTLVEIAGKGR